MPTGNDRGSSSHLPTLESLFEEVGQITADILLEWIIELILQIRDLLSAGAIQAGNQQSFNEAIEKLQRVLDLEFEMNGQAAARPKPELNSNLAEQMNELDKAREASQQFNQPSEKGKQAFLKRIRKELEAAKRHHKEPGGPKGT